METSEYGGSQLYSQIPQTFQQGSQYCQQTTTNDPSRDLNQANTHVTGNPPDNQPARTYSNAVKHSNNLVYQLQPASAEELQQFPTQEQGILMNVVEDLTLTDYLQKIGSIVGPLNILAASRISNGRLCMFLQSTGLVDVIVKNHSTVKIGENTIHVRRLINPSKRIIISNVPAIIPHSSLESLIQSIGFVPQSKLTYLRASVSDDTFRHVVCFRRQIYVQPNEELQLPSSIVVKYLNTNYRLFLAYDEPVCFSCKERGHIASTCPKTNMHQPTNHALEVISTETSSPPTITQCPATQPLEGDEADQQADKTTNDTPTDPTTNTDTTERIHHTLKSGLDSTQSKRPAPESPSECSQGREDETNPATSSMPKFKQPEPPTKNKKLKRSVSTDSKPIPPEILKPVEKYISEAKTPWILSFNQLRELLEKVHGSSNPLNVITGNYTTNIPAVIEMLTSVQPIFPNKNIKNRISRLIKKIQTQTDQKETIESSDYETDSSQKSY